VESGVREKEQGTMVQVSRLSQTRAVLDKAMIDKVEFMSRIQTFCTYSM